MKDLVKEKEWTKKLESFERSGLKIVDWCRQNNETAHQLAYWKKRLQHNVVEFEEISSSSGLEIQCKVIELTFSGDINLNALKACLCSL